MSTVLHTDLLAGMLYGIMSKLCASEGPGELMPVQGRRAEQGRSIATQLEEVAQQIAAITTGRDEVRAKIDKAWLKTYDALIVRGVAVAPVIAGICQGCRVRILPQQNNKLARLETIEACERCGRIIYRKEMLEPPAADAAPAATADAPTA